MPVLTPGRDIRSREPTLLVENQLEPGSWRFRLVVVDDAGLESNPAELVVRVNRALPTGPTRPTGPIVDGPVQPRPGPLEPLQPIRRPT